MWRFKSPVSINPMPSSHIMSSALNASGAIEPRLTVILLRDACSYLLGVGHNAIYWMHSENKTDLLLPSWSLQTFKKHTQENIYNYPFWWALWRENVVCEERNQRGKSSQSEFSEKASPRKIKELDMKPKFGWTSEFFLVQCVFTYLH